MTQRRRASKGVPLPLANSAPSSAVGLENVAHSLDGMKKGKRRPPTDRGTDLRNGDATRARAEKGVAAAVSTDGLRAEAAATAAAGKGNSSSWEFSRRRRQPEQILKLSPRTCGREPKADFEFDSS